METKHWYESKTIWLGIITAIIGIFTLLAQSYPETGILITIVGVLNIIMRTVTSTTIA